VGRAYFITFTFVGIVLESISFGVALGLDVWRAGRGSGCDTHTFVAIVVVPSLLGASELVQQAAPEECSRVEGFGITPFERLGVLAADLGGEGGG
jgi:hypothetical protein